MDTNKFSDDEKKTSKNVTPKMEQNGHDLEHVESLCLHNQKKELHQKQFQHQKHLISLFIWPLDILS